MAGEDLLSRALRALSNALARRAKPPRDEQPGAPPADWLARARPPGPPADWLGRVRRAGGGVPFSDATMPDDSEGPQVEAGTTAEWRPPRPLPRIRITAGRGKRLDHEGAKVSEDAKREVCEEPQEPPASGRGDRSLRPRVLRAAAIQIVRPRGKSAAGRGEAGRGPAGTAGRRGGADAVRASETDSGAEVDQGTAGENRGRGRRLEHEKAQVGEEREAPAAPVRGLRAAPALQGRPGWLRHLRAFVIQIASPSTESRGTGAADALRAGGAGRGEAVNWPRHAVDRPEGACFILGAIPVGATVPGRPRHGRPRRAAPTMKRARPGSADPHRARGVEHGENAGWPAREGGRPGVATPLRVERVGPGVSGGGPTREARRPGGMDPLRTGEINAAKGMRGADGTGADSRTGSAGKSGAASAAAGDRLRGRLMVRKPGHRGVRWAWEGTSATAEAQRPHADRGRDADGWPELSGTTPAGRRGGRPDDPWPALPEHGPDSGWDDWDGTALAALGTLDAQAALAEFAQRGRERRQRLDEEQRGI
jgi:hypothetical protein